MLEETVEVPLTHETLADVVPPVQQRLEDSVISELQAQDVPDDHIDTVLKAHIRYEGTDTSLVRCCAECAQPPLGFTNTGVWLFRSSTWFPET